MTHFLGSREREVISFPGGCLNTRRRRISGQVCPGAISYPGRGPSFVLYSFDKPCSELTEFYDQHSVSEQQQQQQQQQKCYPLMSIWSCQHITSGKSTRATAPIIWRVFTQNVRSSMAGDYTASVLFTVLIS